MVVPLPIPPGLTFPPIDLKNIIDKTVEFVNKGGAAFEATIIAKGKDNPAFGFIKPGHPFHPYYKYKLSEIRAAAGTTAPAPAEEEKKAPITAAPTVVSKVAAAPPKIVKPKNLEPPPPLEFYLNLPDISAQELDIMRLTAQFVARNGQQFHHGLLNRENRNPQFDFLKHNHPLNIIFSTLVNCYSRVLLPPRDIVDKVKNPNIRDRTVILEKAVSHMEWEQSQERARKQAEQEEDEERMAMASIDWHDFVVVETIEFFDDEADLPAPATYDQLIAGLTPAAAAEEVRVVEEAEMETDEMEMEDEEAPAAPAPAPAPAAAPAEPAPPARPISPEPESSLPLPTSALPIRKEPLPKRVEAKKQMMMICPRCNMQVPQDEYSEHMRIELLDPKFREMQVRLEANKKTSTAALGNADVSKNLSSFSKYRSDIFGTVETDIGKAVGEEEDKGPEKVTWDGHTASIGRTTSAALQGKSISDQINAIHASKGYGGGDEKPSIGPHSVGIHAHTPQAVPRQPIITVVGGAPAAIPSMPRPIIAPAVPGLPAQPPPPLMGMPHMGMPMPYGMPPGMMPGMMPPGMPPGMYPPMMPPGMPHQPPPPEDEPNAKRHKTEEINLIPEEKFLADYPSPVNIVVQVPPAPGDKNEWNFQGQQLEITLPPTSTINNVKEKIKEALGMPPNKQKLRTNNISIFKDTNTLAYYNVTPGTVVVLGIKERGGRKK